MSNASFACAVNCMDGRTQEPVIKYLKQRLHVDYVDAVTEPDQLNFSRTWTQSGPKYQACCDISVKKHRAKAIAL